MTRKRPFRHRRHHHLTHPRKRGYHLKHKRRSPHYTHPRKHYHLKHKRKKPHFTHKRKKPRSYAHKRGYHLKHKRVGRHGLHRKHHQNKPYHLKHKRRSLHKRAHPTRYATVAGHHHHRHKRSLLYVDKRRKVRLHHLHVHTTVAHHRVSNFQGRLNVHKMHNAIYRNRGRAAR